MGDSIYQEAVRRLLPGHEVKQVTKKTRVISYVPEQGFESYGQAPPLSARNQGSIQELVILPPESLSEQEQKAKRKKDGDDDPRGMIMSKGVQQVLRPLSAHNFSIPVQTALVDVANCSGGDGKSRPQSALNRPSSAGRSRPSSRPSSARPGSANTLSADALSSDGAKGKTRPVGSIPVIRTRTDPRQKSVGPPLYPRHEEAASTRKMYDHYAAVRENTRRQTSPVKEHMGSPTSMSVQSRSPSALKDEEAAKVDHRLALEDALPPPMYDEDSATKSKPGARAKATLVGDRGVQADFGFSFRVVQSLVTPAQVLTGNASSLLLSHHQNLQTGSVNFGVPRFEADELVPDFAPLNEEKTHYVQSWVTQTVGPADLAGSATRQRSPSSRRGLARPTSAGSVLLKSQEGHVISRGPGRPLTPDSVFDFESASQTPAIDPFMLNPPRIVGQHCVARSEVKRKPRPRTAGLPQHRLWPYANVQSSS